MFKNSHEPEFNDKKLAEHFVEAEIALQRAMEAKENNQAEKWLAIAKVHATLATADRAVNGLQAAKDGRRKEESRSAGGAGADPTSNDPARQPHASTGGRPWIQVGFDYTDETSPTKAQS